MNEIVFLVEKSAEGGWVARALGESIFTEADTREALHDCVRDAVRCHFDDEPVPTTLRLRFVHEEIIAA